MDKIKIEKAFYTAKNISELTGLALPTCYKLVQQCNNELKASGCITFDGKVPIAYLKRRIGIE